MTEEYFSKFLKAREEKNKHLSAAAPNIDAGLRRSEAENKTEPVLPLPPEAPAGLPVEQRPVLITKPIAEPLPVENVEVRLQRSVLKSDFNTSSEIAANVNPPGEKIMEVKNLTVSFGRENVLDNLSFTLNKGENLAIIGPNGAGKTVLLKCLLGTIPFGGEIKWKDGVKISYVPQKILQERGLPLSVEEFFKIRGFADKNAIKESLESVGLRDPYFMKKRISDISSGQLQRLLIAWGLAGNPETLLFDEPTSGIDIGGEETVYNLLAEMEKERNLSIILVTHDLNIVYKFADKVLCLNKNLVCFGEPKEALEPGSISRLYGGEVKFYTHEH